MPVTRIGTPERAYAKDRMCNFAARLETDDDDEGVLKEAHDFWRGSFAAMDVAHKVVEEMNEHGT